MCKYFDLLLYFKQESILLLILSVFNKLSTLSAPSTINFFLQISTCLIWPNWYCLIHFSKRLRLLHPNSNLSNMTKLILLDSLLQEVRETGIQIATWLIWPNIFDNDCHPQTLFWWVRWVDGSLTLLMYSLKWKLENKSNFTCWFWA